MPVPDDLSAEQVAAILTKGLTAWAGLNGYHALQPGQTVLVQGASSSVGNLLARWAKALGGVVIGTAGSPEKRAALATAIDHVLPSDAPDLAARWPTTYKGASAKRRQRCSMPIGADYSARLPQPAMHSRTPHRPMLTSPGGKRQDR